MTGQNQQFGVSKRALAVRINRRLADYDRKLLTTNKPLAQLYLGRYYVVDTQVGGAVETHCDLEDLGRELGALKDWETLLFDE